MHYPSLVQNSIVKVNPAYMLILAKLIFGDFPTFFIIKRKSFLTLSLKILCKLTLIKQFIISFQGAFNNLEIYYKLLYKYQLTKDF